MRWSGFLLILFCLCSQAQTVEDVIDETLRESEWVSGIYDITYNFSESGSTQATSKLWSNGLREIAYNRCLRGRNVSSSRKHSLIRFITLHEVAHFMAWLEDPSNGEHDANFRRALRSLGVRQEVKGDGVFSGCNF